MRKLFEVLEINENDNLGTAFGKGMIKGTVKSSLVTLALGGVVIFLGKGVEHDKRTRERIMAE